MAKKASFLKVLFNLFLLLIGIAIIAPICLILIINPNNYKPDIQSYLTEKSGYPIALNGDINLTFFPWIGLTVHDIIVNTDTTSQTTPLFSAKAIKLKLPIKKLLAWEFRLDSLEIEEGNFNLIKHKDGSVNWDKPSQTITTATTRSSESNLQQETPASNQKDSHGPSLYFSISLLAVKNGTLKYTDLSNQKTLTLSEMTFSGEDLGQALKYPIKGDFNFNYHDNAKNQTVYAGNTKLKGLFPKPENDQFILETGTIHANWQDRINNQSHQLDASLNMVLQPNKNIRVDNLSATLDDAKLTGKLNIPLNAAPITYNLSINQLDLNKLASQMDQNPSSNIQPVAYIEVKQQNSKKMNLPNSQGTLKINQIKHQQLSATNVVLKARTEGNILTVEPLTADVFDGKLNATISKDFNTSSPLYVKGNANQIDTQVFFKTMANVNNLKGRGNFDFTFAHTPQNLSGTTKVSITNGAILGLDLDYFYDMAENFVKKQAVNQSKNDAITPFNQLTAIILLNNNVLSNEDLVMLNNEYRVTGRGQINLAKQTIDYDIKAQKIYRDGREHPNALPLAVSINGPLSKPQIQPDLDLYLKLILEREAKKQIEKNLDKQIGKILGGEEDGSSKKNIEEEIGKGLKKLFGL